MGTACCTSRSADPKTYLDRKYGFDKTTDDALNEGSGAAAPELEPDMLLFR
jgi:hypothetical protein